jgi:peptide-methionine (S)-S-oxide reductase
MKNKIIFLILSLLVLNKVNSNSQHFYQKAKYVTMIQNIETATLGAGCYWCVEAIFQRIKGITSVESGFSGGHVENPSYREVCTGTTGHAEVCQIKFDPQIISYIELLEIFFKIHDPTTLNRQGNDIGTQYRSIIFYHNEKQRQLAIEIKEKLEKANIWEDPIVTEIVPFVAFYKAEDYHQNYYNKNPQQPYCNFVITPKIEKFEKVFKEKLKSN